MRPRKVVTARDGTACGPFGFSLPLYSMTTSPSRLSEWYSAMARSVVAASMTPTARLPTTPPIPPQTPAGAGGGAQRHPRRQRQPATEPSDQPDDRGRAQDQAQLDHDQSDQDDRHDRRVDARAAGVPEHDPLLVDACGVAGRDHRAGRDQDRAERHPAPPRPGDPAPPAQR